MPVKAYDMLAHTLTRAGIPGPKALQALRHYVVAGGRGPRLRRGL